MCKCRIGRSSDVFLQKFSYLINQLWRLWCVAREQSVWIIAQAAERRARRVRHPQVGRPPPEHRAEPLPGQVQATQALRGTASSRCFVLGCSCCLICWYFDNGWRSFMSMMSKWVGYELGTLWSGCIPSEQTAFCWQLKDSAGLPGKGGKPQWLVSTNC